MKINGPRFKVLEIASSKGKAQLVEYSFSLTSGSERVLRDPCIDR